MEKIIIIEPTREDSNPSIEEIIRGFKGVNNCKYLTKHVESTKRKRRRFEVSGDFKFLDLLSEIYRKGYTLVLARQISEKVYPQKTNDYDWRGQK